jgi:hypothetical protein
MRDDSPVQWRVRAEYTEMPGLRLTLEQTQRLCGVERGACQAILDALVAEKFLWRTPKGLYARVSEGSVSRPQPAKAELHRKPRVAMTA